MKKKLSIKKRRRESIPKSLETWLTILSVTFISLLAFETMAVATAMPFIVDILDGQNLYALAVGIVLASQLMTTALAGPWCDAKGPKPCFFTGVGLVSIGLTICTFAPSIEWIVAGRAIQGLGGGLLVVPLYVLVGNYVKPQNQPKIFAAFATAWVVPSFVGPFVAGVLVEHVNWRWVFGITPIVFFILLPLAWAQFKKFPPLHEPQPLKAINTVWFATAAGLGIALLQVVSTQQEGFTFKTLAVLFVGAVLAINFSRLILPVGTFRAHRGVPATVLFRGILNGALLAVELYLPLILKELHNWSPTRAGLILTASSVSWAIAAHLQGNIKDPAMRRRIPMIGLVCQLIGTALTIFAISRDITGIIVLAGWFIAGFGIGFVYPHLSVHALGLTPPSRHGEVSSALQIADTLGASVMIAVAGISFAVAQGLGDLAYGVPIILVVVLLALTAVIPGRLEPTDRPTSDAHVTRGTDAAEPLLGQARSSASHALVVDDRGDSHQN